VAALVEWLSGRGWVKARDIMAAFPSWNERAVREVASDSRGRILSGQQGYKLTLECTPEEVRHATAWLRSQANQMTQRSIDIDRTFHQGARHEK
jgi:hypothetical protein